MTLSELATQYNAARPCAVLTVNNCVQALAMLLSMNHDAPLTEESQDGAFWGYKGQIHAIENSALENTKTPFDVWVNDGSRGSTYKFGPMGSPSLALFCLKISLERLRQQLDSAEELVRYKALNIEDFTQLIVA